MSEQSRTGAISESMQGFEEQSDLAVNSDGVSQYKHWNIFFKDIYRVSIDIVDRETNKVISKQDIERDAAGVDYLDPSRNVGAPGASNAHGD